MFILTAHYKPNYPTMAKLRTVLFEWVTEQQANGRPFALFLDLWTEAGAAFRVASMHDSVGQAWDQRGIPTSPETPNRAFIPSSSSVSPFHDRPPGWTLHEIVVPSDIKRTCFIELHVSLRPSVGNLPGLKGELEEWVSYRQAQGENISLIERIWSPNGPEFQLRIGYEGLTDADRVRNELADDQRNNEISKKLVELTSGPPIYLLQEAPVPWKSD